MNQPPGARGSVVLSSSGPAVPVEIRDSRLKLVDEGLSDETFLVSPGTYIVAAYPPGGQVVETVEVASDASASVSIGTHRAAATPTPRTTPPSWSLQEATYVPTESGEKHRAFESVDEAEALGVDVLRRNLVRPERSVPLRFFEIGGQNEALDSDAQVVEQRVGDSRTVISVRSDAEELTFAQLAVEGELPLNVALPTDQSGRSELSMQRSTGVPLVAAYPAADRARMATQYLAEGQAKFAAKMIAPEDAEQMLQGKMTDVIGATVGGYILLRQNKLDPKHQWATNLANWFPWLPDGAVIAGELSARNLEHKDAVQYFLTAWGRGLPIFTEGFSALYSRLRYYGTHEAVEPNSRKRAMMASRESIRWSLFVDFSAPTLTFRGGTPNRPGEATEVDPEAFPYRVEFE